MSYEHGYWRLDSLKLVLYLSKKVAKKIKKKGTTGMHHNHKF